MTALMVGPSASVLTVAKSVQSWALRCGISPDGSEKVGSGDLFGKTGVGIFRVGSHHGEHEDVMFVTKDGTDRVAQLGAACSSLILVVDCNEGMDAAIADSLHSVSILGQQRCLVVLMALAGADPELREFARMEVMEFCEARDTGWSCLDLVADQSDSCICAKADCDHCGTYATLTTPTPPATDVAHGLHMSILCVYEKVKVTANKRISQAVPFGLITSGSARAGDVVYYVSDGVPVSDQIEAVQEYGRNRDVLVSGQTATLLLKNSDSKSLRGVSSLTHESTPAR